MFDQILQLVKDQLGNNPQATAALPADQADAVHQEIASHITDGLQTHADAAGGTGGLMGMLENGLSSGHPVVSAIEGGLVSSLGSKFGLSPAITGAIAASLPGLLQNFVNKSKAPGQA